MEVTMVKFSDEWLRRVDAGLEPNAQIVYKAGRLNGMTTNYTPVTSSGTYPTPTVADSLEVVSDNIEDSPLGTGATHISIQGLGPDWLLKEQVFELNGTTPVPIGLWTRIYRTRITASNTYASTALASHDSTITTREVGTGIVWAAIDTEGGLGVGTSMIACFSVPLGYRAHIINEQIFTETAKPVDILLVSRDRINDIVAPYSIMKWDQIHYSLNSQHNSAPRGIGPVMVGPFDLGYMAKSATNTATCAILFEILLLKDY